MKVGSALKAAAGRRLNTLAHVSAHSGRKLRPSPRYTTNTNQSARYPSPMFTPMAPWIPPTSTPLMAREAHYRAREQFCQFELMAFNQRLADKKSACFGVFSPPLSQLHTALRAYLRTSPKLTPSHPNFDLLESIESSLGDIFYELEDEFQASLVDRRPGYHRWSWEPNDRIAKMLFEQVPTFEKLVFNVYPDQSDYEESIRLRERLDTFLNASDIIEEEPYSVFTYTQEHRSLLTSASRPLLYADDGSSVANNTMIDVANDHRLGGSLIVAVGGSIVEGNIVENVGNATSARCPKPLMEEPPKSDPPDGKQTREDTRECLEQHRHRLLPETLTYKLPSRREAMSIPLVILLFIASSAMYICFCHREM